MIKNQENEDKNMKDRQTTPTTMIHDLEYQVILSKLLSFLDRLFDAVHISLSSAIYDQDIDVATVSRLKIKSSYKINELLLLFSNRINSLLNNMFSIKPQLKTSISQIITSSLNTLITQKEFFSKKFLLNCFDYFSSVEKPKIKQLSFFLFEERMISVLVKIFKSKIMVDKKEKAVTLVLMALYMDAIANDGNLIISDPNFRVSYDYLSPIFEREYFQE